MDNCNGDTVTELHCEGSGGCIKIAGAGNFENKFTTCQMGMMQKALISSTNSDPNNYNEFDHIVVNRYPVNRTSGQQPTGGPCHANQKDCVKFSKTIEGLDSKHLVVHHMTVIADDPPPPPAAAAAAAAGDGKSVPRTIKTDDVGSRPPRQEEHHQRAAGGSPAAAGLELRVEQNQRGRLLSPPRESDPPERFSGPKKYLPV